MCERVTNQIVRRFVFNILAGNTLNHVPLHATRIHVHVDIYQVAMIGRKQLETGLRSGFESPVGKKKLKVSLLIYIGRPS